MKLTAAYFSPTGGTETAVRLLAEKLGYPATLIDLTLPAAREQEYRLGKEDLLLAACPVYAGRIPSVPGLFENLSGDGTPCVLLVAYGNRHYDDTLAQMQRLLEGRGFVCAAGAACVIPHCFSGLLGAGRPDAADAQVLAAFAEEVRRRIADPVPAAFPGNPLPEPKERTPMEKTWDAAKCTRCMACARRCPAGAISFETLSIDPASCIDCTRCAKVCAPQARGYEAGRVRAYLEGNYTARREIETFL